MHSSSQCPPGIGCSCSCCWYIHPNEEDKKDDDDDAARVDNDKKAMTTMATVKKRAMPVFNGVTMILVGVRTPAS
jgi:hypothetical protein